MKFNKGKIDEYIPKAYEALTECKIANENKCIVRTFRGYISSFGAAIAMGSLKSAIAYFSKDEKKRSLLNVLYYVLNGKTCEDKPFNDEILLNSNESDVAEKGNDIYNAAIAVKLAMNMYEPIKESSQNVEPEKNLQ